MLETTRIVAKIKYLPVYTCSVCKTKAAGGTARVEVDVADTEELKYMVDRMTPSPHQMPIGWGSYSDGFRCPAHIV